MADYLNSSLDSMDLAIIAKLRKDGRATNREIAEELGLTASTVSTRIKQMESSGLLRIIAVSDFSAHDHNILIQVAIELDNRPVWEAVEELAAFPEVFAAHVVSGNYEIDLLLTLPDFESLRRFMLEDLSKVRGIRAMTPSVAVDIRKYAFDHALS